MKIRAMALLLAITALSTGCALQTPAEVVGGTILAADSVGAARSELGEYSQNQDVIAELDQLQAEILTTVATGAGALDVIEYHDRALTIYATLKQEAGERWAELSPEQQALLMALDVELVALNGKAAELRKLADGAGAALGVVSTAATLLKFYGRTL